MNEPGIAAALRSNVDDMWASRDMESSSFRRHQPSTTEDQSHRSKRNRKHIKTLRSQDANDSIEHAPQKDKNLKLVNQYRKMMHLSPKNPPKQHSQRASMTITDASSTIREPKRANPATKVEGNLYFPAAHKPNIRLH